MSVSDVFKEAARSQSTAECPVALIKLDGAAMDAPLLFNTSGSDLVHDGDTYLNFPFTVQLPSDPQDSPSTAKLVIDNIDRRVTAAVRKVIPQDITVDMKVVLADSPDVVESEFVGFMLKNISYDAYTLEGSLTLEDFTTEPFPGDVVTKATCPGLY